MSESKQVEFDPFEYADQLGYVDELGRGDHSDESVVRAESPESRRQGLTRRELFVKGGIGAMALSGAGTLAAGADAASSSREKAGAFKGTLNVISLGVEWPTGAQAQAEKDLGFK